jgi:flagellar export protein FliJ
MKKFKFTLDSVHRVREIRKERETSVLAGLRADAERAEKRVAHIEDLRREAIETYTRRLARGERIDAMEMELSSRHFSSLDRLQLEAEAHLAERRRACEAQVLKVTEAMREVKITENLRETQHERHRFETDRREQVGIDEMVAAGFARERQKQK